MNDPIIGIFENSKRAKDWTDTYSWLNQPTTYEMSDAAIKKIVKKIQEKKSRIMLLNEMIISLQNELGKVSSELLFVRLKQMSTEKVKVTVKNKKKV